MACHCSRGHRFVGQHAANSGALDGDGSQLSRRLRSADAHARSMVRTARSLSPSTPLPADCRRRGFPPNTIFIFTANSRDGLLDRFMSRVKTLPFSKEGMSGKIVELLASIWASEAGDAPAPNFARIVKDSCNNVRDAINTVEIELMAIE